MIKKSRWTIAFGMAVVFMAPAASNAQTPELTTEPSTTPPQINAPAVTTPAEKTFDGFAATRSEILTLIGGATQNIRVVTDFLSDGEIVSALYIAQYRKVNVQVLLGQGRATHVLSRLNFLKAQNIPVWLRPKHFMTTYPTLLLVDQNLYSLNAELDYMARHRKFTLTPLSSNLVSGFEADFQNAANSGISPSPKPTPLVGRPGNLARRKSYAAAAPESSVGPEASNQAGSDEWRDGNPAYRYGRKKDKPSTGVPTKLPRNTILQERSQQH